MSTDPLTWVHDGTATLAFMVDLANVGYDALAFTRLGQPAELGISHAEPAEDCTDFLALWVSRWLPYVPGQFPAVQKQDPRAMRVLYAPELVFTLRRPCPPTLSASATSPFPSGTAKHAAATDMIVDIRALQCALIGGAAHDVLATHHGPGAKILWGETTPYEQGGTSGWDMRFSVEFANACCGDV